ncbi:phage tail sheath subtilisin-like domain-containing protein [Siccirubricoccus sp. KC 17139]|uniref:Phage tail sheath subtilisin-like domain-containing protein n=1 Tax=Siccirubricoccus soli TaxID=2899147 RepID=A0ABT1CYS7_9PROT|nr:phage tail sheath subtilisin-like domain-containing protein [Siccirubricoccus soli]MCO6414815.1 phage tail sheath subtilisin-like domain-containing protein [Siccirubricoccus soli]MCP2680945.1 phage tail sheath subtilisin-like domain-containing protein [Siccirubricoccus soli]
MAIQFSLYPASNRVTGIYAEIDPSLANTATDNQKTLIMGQMLAAGSATANTAVLVTSYQQARSLFGAGSMLSLMYQQYRKSDNFGEVWCSPVTDNASGTAATNTITVAGTATAPGTLNLYIAGQRIQVGVAVADAAAAIAAKINAAINAAIDLPATSGVATATVTVTARHKGVTAGDLDIRLNYAGAAGNEFTPAGVTITIGAGTAGTGEPSLVNAFANLGDAPYDFIAFPWSGTTELASLTNLLSDTIGRWAWNVSLFGHAFTAREGTASTLASYGAALNDQHVTVLGINDTPTPIYNVAADYAAVCARSLRADPALPLQNLTMGILPPPRGSRFLLNERNTLLYSGISTAKVNDAGQAILERSVTTYQKNAAGAADDSYLDTETLTTLQFLIRDLKNVLGTKFARKKLVADGTPVPGGSSFVTPSTVKGEVIAWYRGHAANGMVQNVANFTQNMKAENAGSGRVSLLLPIDVANQLRIISTLVQFTKS